jgi:hypothetical protein
MLILFQLLNEFLAALLAKQLPLVPKCLVQKADVVMRELHGLQLGVEGAKLYRQSHSTIAWS